MGAVISKMLQILPPKSLVNKSGGAEPHPTKLFSRKLFREVQAGELAVAYS